MSKNRFIRWVGIASACAVVGGFGFLPQASAHIGASHSQPATAKPDLTTAAILADGTTVQACFDAAIGTVVDATDIQVTGYDSDVEFNFPTGTINASNPKCVDLDGSTNLSLSQMRILSVNGLPDAGDVAVQDTSGNDNIPGAVLLSGGAAAADLGESDAPELKTAAAQAGGQAVYGFDENIDVDPDSYDPEDFGFHTGNGDIKRGDTVVTTSGKNVTIGFTTAGDDPTQAQRWFADTDDDGACGRGPGNTDEAVNDRGTDAATGGALEGNSKFNLLGAIPVAATTAPDPTAAAIAGTATINYTFDEPLAGAIDELCFIAHEADGDIFDADSAIFLNPPNPTIVQATFPAGAPTNQLVVAGVLPDGVFSSSDPTDGNTYGSFSLSDRLDPGFSDGPDLEQVTTDSTNNRATGCFDTDEELDPGGSVPDDEFFLYNADGNEFQSDILVSVSGNCATWGGFTAVNAASQAVAGGLDDDDDSIFEDSVQETADVTNCTTCAIGGGDNGNDAVPAATVKVGGPAVTPPGPPPPPPPPLPPPPPPPPTATCPQVGGYNGIHGTSGDDNIRGTADCDKIKGKGGDDKLKGKGEDDKLIGGPGDDVLKGGPGDDICKGGPGHDTLKSC